MRTLAVVQARTGSTRLPGKVLMPIAGRPMLGFMLARLAAAPVDDMVVATSANAGDDALADVASAAGVAVVRGSESDVLGRFLTALDGHPADIVVRLTADCPLVDAGVVADAIACRDAAGADYASNTLVRTYPDGLDVEVLTAGSLRTAAAEAVDPAEREHVTPFVYRRPERFRLAAVLGPESLGDERWTVDTADDLARVRTIVEGLADPVTAGWREILAVAGRAVAPAGTDMVLRPARAADDSAFTAPVRFGATVHTPAVRSWVAEAGGRPVGWAQVTTPSSNWCAWRSPPTIRCASCAPSTRPRQGAHMDEELAVPRRADELEELWAGEFGDAYIGRNAPTMNQRAPFWARTLERYPSRRVLEVGCANGANLDQMAKLMPPEQLWGADINLQALDVLRATVPGANGAFSVPSALVSKWLFGCDCARRGSSLPCRINCST